MLKSHSEISCKAFAWTTPVAHAQHLMHRSFNHVRLSYFLASYLTHALQQHIIAHSISQKITDKLHHFVRNLPKSHKGTDQPSSTSTPSQKRIQKYQEIPSF